MSIRLARGRRPLSLSLPVALCMVTLVSVGVLLVWDLVPGLFPARAHDFLAAFPLAMIAFSCLVYEAVRRPSRSELIKAILLACAFLFWAANQFWPGLRHATLFNDIAIGLFVFDVFLAMIGRPISVP
jgi:O-antigen ligase